MKHAAFPKRLQGKKEHLILPLARISINGEKQDLVNCLADWHSVGHDKDPGHWLPITYTLVRSRRDC